MYFSPIPTIKEVSFTLTPQIKKIIFRWKMSKLETYIHNNLHLFIL